MALQSYDIVATVTNTTHAMLTMVAMDDGRVWRCLCGEGRYVNNGANAYEDCIVFTMMR